MLLLIVAFVDCCFLLIAIIYSLPIKKNKLFDQFDLCVRFKNENRSFVPDGPHPHFFDPR